MRRLEKEDNGQSSSNFSLELAGRGSETENCPERDNTILTISMQDDHSVEISPQNVKSARSRCRWSKRFHTRLEIALLAGSFLLFTVSAILVEYFKHKSRASAAVQTFLLILRSIGIFTFFGELALVFAITIAFSQSCICYAKRLTDIETQSTARILKHLFLSVVLEETVVAEYLKSLSSGRDQNYCTRMLDFLNSSAMDEFIDGKLKQISLAPEGCVLEMLGIEQSDLCTLSRLFVTEAICDIYSLVYKDIKQCDLTRPESVKKHVETIANQQLSRMTSRETNKLLRQFMDCKLVKMNVCIFVFMALVGCVLQLVYACGLLYS